MATDAVKEIDRGDGTSSHYQEYVKLLTKLHFLMAEGNGDTEEADQLRDLMDDPWYQMSPQEVHRAEGLSADLYTLVDPPAPVQHVDQQEIDEFHRLASSALHDKDWDQMLELLREHPHPFAADSVAIIRAVCWNNLGDRETSFLFLKRGITLNPQHLDSLMPYMETLFRSEMSQSINSLDDSFRSSQSHPAVSTGKQDEKMGPEV
jgi:hypothetical protein